MAAQARNGLLVFLRDEYPDVSRGAAQCRMRDMLQAEYSDPDGERLYCINSEIANLKIRLFRRTHGVRWRHIETIKAYATAHLEHAARVPDSQLKMAFD